MFTPHNKHIEVDPIEQDSVVASQNTTFEEKGRVLAAADDCEYNWEEGDIVYFDAWLVAKYVDKDGKERYLVPEDKVRAYEPISE